MNMGTNKPIAYTRAKYLVLSDRAATLERRGCFQEAAECWQEVGQFAVTSSESLWCESRSALCLYQRDMREGHKVDEGTRVSGGSHENK
ncbi:ANR family transcriptional regulator [Rahnella aceris]|uniref:ANR family transcriptional regulator n=1 Tax=Rahnella sp. (strain Y9602) TaxID=2703885 RepID=UPI001C26D526|nr:ANR family transcriptional regulator [Rahnella aceris]MBU9839039.1 ANR family transcriptional regulator [Rahnella aceris]